MYAFTEVGALGTGGLRDKAEVTKGEKCSSARMRPPPVEGKWQL